MWSASSRFNDVITGTHQRAVRVVLLPNVQFGVIPTGGTELPVLGGEVKFSARSDVKGSAELEVPGDYLDLLRTATYGDHLFIERGVSFGDGTREMVPLGYFMVWDVEQENAPNGPIRITAYDRTKRLMDNNVLFPYQVTAGGRSHRYMFQRLVNGNGGGGQSTEGYGMFIHHAVPIIWADYNPDTVMVPGGTEVKDSTYEFLSDIAAEQGCGLFFNRAGELTVRKLDVPTANPVHTLRPGRNGNLIRASWSVTREGVKNIVSAYGSDPASPTGYALAYNNDVNSPMFWSGKFGAAPRYFASPLLKTTAAAQSAASTVLSRYTGLPESVSLFTVPNPVFELLDVLTVVLGTRNEIHVAEEVTIPLDVTKDVQITTKTTNLVKVIEPTPTPTPTPPPAPDPTPTPGNPGGNPDDGTQAAVLLGWGSVLAGDEFNYTGAPDPAKWSVYNGPGHAGNGLRRPSAFNVHDGMVTCTGDNVSGGTTGGMAYKREEYGTRIEWRARTYSINPSASGNRYHPVLILWPTSNQWPQGAEYDFFETDCDSGKFGLYMHLPNHTPYRQDHVSKPLDIQNWHNYACEWNPIAKTLKTWVDGVLVYNGTGRVAEAPGSMHATIQLDNFFGSNMCPGKFDAMWVRVYAKPNA